MNDRPIEGDILKGPLLQRNEHEFLRDVTPDIISVLEKAIYSLRCSRPSRAMKTLENALEQYQGPQEPKKPLPTPPAAPGAPADKPEQLISERVDAHRAIRAEKYGDDRNVETGDPIPDTDVIKGNSDKIRNRLESDMRLVVRGHERIKVIDAWITWYDQQQSKEYANRYIRARSNAIAQGELPLLDQVTEAEALEAEDNALVALTFIRPFHPGPNLLVEDRINMRPPSV